MYESLKTLNATMEAAKKEMQAKGKDAIHAAFKELFAARPEVLAVTWKQYTPYFNDGDTCEFSVGGWSVRLKDTAEDSEGDYGEEGFESEYSMRMFMKFTIQSSTVKAARPSRNRCQNGMPPRLVSFETYCVAASTRKVGASSLSQRAS